MRNMQQGQSFFTMMALVTACLSLASPAKADLTLTESAKGSSGNAANPGLGGYVVLCETSTDGQTCGSETSVSDIAVFNGTTLVSFFSDVSTDEIFGNPAADLGFGAAFLAALHNNDGKPGATVYCFEDDPSSAETGHNFNTSCSGKQGTGTVIYKPTTGQPGFPTNGAAAETFTLVSDCGSPGACATPEPSSLLLLITVFLGLVGVLRKQVHG